MPGSLPASAFETFDTGLCVSSFVETCAIAPTTDAFSVVRIQQLQLHPTFFHPVQEQL